MKHVVLAGDSIFDNRPYVAKGETVSDILVSKLHYQDKFTLLAVDGHITQNVIQQIEKLPESCTDLFISVGGNDALQNAYLLSNQVNTAFEAFELFDNVIQSFSHNYRNMLDHVLTKCRAVDCSNLTLCTIYDAVPGLGKAEKLALSLFNAEILKIAGQYQLNVIDMRLICNEETDYSVISPIEPSFEGGKKITDTIANIIYKQSNSLTITNVFQ